MSEMRKWEPRERQMRSEYIAKYLMGARWITEYRLGRALESSLSETLTESERRALSYKKATADLVVFLPEKLEIYEFQVVPKWHKFGQLIAYKKLALVTDELRLYWDKAIEGILINAINDPFLASLCREHGLLFRVYTPEWLSRYYDTLHPFERTPTQLIPVAER